MPCKIIVCQEDRLYGSHFCPKHRAEYLDSSANANDYLLAKNNNTYGQVRTCSIAVCHRVISSDRNLCNQHNREYSYYACNLADWIGCENIRRITNMKTCRVNTCIESSEGPYSLCGEHHNEFISTNTNVDDWLLYKNYRVCRQTYSCIIDWCLGTTNVSEKGLCEKHQREYNYTGQHYTNWVAYKNKNPNEKATTQMKSTIFLQKKSTAQSMYERAKAAKKDKDLKYTKEDDCLYNRYLAFITKLANRGEFKVSLEALQEEMTTGPHNSSYINGKFLAAGFTITGYFISWDEKVLK